MNFIDQVTCGPGIDPRDEDSARVGLERWCEAAETLDDGGQAEAFKEVQDVLLGLGGESMLQDQWLRHVVTRVTDEGLIIELFERQCSRYDREVSLLVSRRCKDSSCRLRSNPHSRLTMFNDQRI